MRNTKGQFKETTGSTQYKAVQFKGQRMDEHRRQFCIILNIDNIPKGLVVHHLDKNKKNNDINNLALITVTAHNRIHSHKAWNKGLTLEDKRMKDLLNKALETRKSNFINKKGKEVYELKKQGLTFREIGKRLNITHETASHRMHRYLEYYKLQNPSEEKRIEKYLNIQKLRCKENKKWEDVGKILNDNPHNLRRFYNNFINNKNKLV